MGKIESDEDLPRGISLAWWAVYLVIGALFQVVRFALRRRRLNSSGAKITTSIVTFLRRVRAGSRVARQRRQRFLWKSRLYDPVSFWIALKGQFRDSNELPENWDSIRHQTYSKDGYTCQVCGRNSRSDDIELHADHIIPRQWGGDHSQENLRTLCIDCHAVRHLRPFFRY